MSIGAKFNLLTISLTLAATVGIALFFIQEEKSNAYEELLIHGESVALMMAQNSEYAIYTQDKQSLDSIVGSVAGDPDIARAAVLDKGESELVRLDKSPSLRIPKRTTSAFVQRTGRILSEEFVNREDNLAYINILAAVTSSMKGPSSSFLLSDETNTSEEIIGFVQLVLTEQRIRQRIDKLFWTTVIVAAALIIFGVLLTVLITRRIVRPLKDLANATQNIAEGRFDRRVEINTNDELSDLSRAFNHMLGRLMESWKKIEQRTDELSASNESLMREISERKKAESHITRLNEELELRVKERTEELEKAYEDLMELDKLKDSFLSSVSHELRTPLTSIRSFAEILLQYDDEDPQTQKEFVEIIQIESERLTRLINDFLDLSKIEAGKAVYHDDLVSLEEIIRHTVKSQHQVSKKNSVTLTLDIRPDLPFVFADRDRIQQVIMNLLTNAIKFSFEGGEVRLTAETFEGKRSGETSQWIRVSVSDAGIGIEEKDFEIIFDKFGQISTDTLKDKPKGTGLGLPICREIISHYGGNIWVESRKGEGSTFFFTLPAAPFAASFAEEALAETMDAGSEHGKTILVVDDNPNMRKLLRYHFQKKGYNVLEAAEGQQVVHLASQNPIDLITLDLMMPTMTGYDVLGIIRDDPATKEIPILIISVIEDKERGIILGASDHLTKPFRQDDLMEKVQGLLGEKYRSILVVDDEAPVREILSAQLQTLGYSVEVAPSGEDAIDLLSDHVPDLVLLDVMMHGTSGYDVLSWIRKEPNTANLPVVMMSGYSVSGERSQFLKTESDAFVGKSEGLNSLLQKVEHMLQ